MIKSDAELLQEAIDFARPFHEAIQPGYFDDHVLAVLREVQKHTNNVNIHIAAVCHDLVEDTDCTLVMVHERFGYAVAWLVDCVTDEDGPNRKERQWRPYHKIRRSRMTILIKLGDRIDNLRRCLRDPQVRFSQMYLKEDMTFRSALWDNLEWSGVWDTYFDLINLLERQVERSKMGGLCCEIVA